MGSEMCIRDRCTHASSGRSWAAGRSFASPPSPAKLFQRRIRVKIRQVAALHSSLALSPTYTYLVHNTWYHTYVVVLCTVLASEKKATRCPRARPQQHTNLGFHKETGSRREAAASGLPPQACGWASRGTSGGLAFGRWGRRTVWCGCSS